MSPEAAIDNDVAIKGACYGILHALALQLGGHRSAAVLGAARFVVSNRLARQAQIQDRDSAKAEWTAFLALAEELEPTPTELDLATELEEAAAVAGVSVDTGESQLCAIVVSRDIKQLITGDKRAIEGIEVLLARGAPIANLANRLVCLEQLMSWAAKLLGASAMRVRVCQEHLIDKTMSICFECTGDANRLNFQPIGLASYVSHLRDTAPTVLCQEFLFD